MLNEVMIANKNYASIVVEDRKSLDKIAIKVIRYDCPSFLLPMRLVSIDNEVQLRFEILGGIRLSYMSLQMKKHELDKLLNQLLSPYTDCADWFLDFHNIYLDRNYIMVDQNDLKVRYVYMPYVHTTQTEEQIMRFFCDLVMDVELQDEPAYIATLMRCIMGKDASVNAFANLIRENLKKEESPSGKGTPVKTPAQRIPAPAPAMPAPAPQVSVPVLEKEASEPVLAESGKEFGVNDLASSIGAGLFGENEKSAGKKADKKHDKKEKALKEKDSKEKDSKENKNFFGRLLGTDKKTKKETTSSNEENKREVMNAASAPAAREVNEYHEQPAEQQQSYAADDFKTEICEEEEVSSGMLRLRLERSLVNNIPSVIELDMGKGYAVIGRYDKTGKLSADFNFDMSLTFIGRRHARFEMAGDDLYIIDLESKNHTYLNDEELLPNRRYLLHKGDRITLTRKYSIVYQVC